MTYPIMTVRQTYDIMMQDVEELVDANYHTEAAFLEDQAAAMSNAASFGTLLGYFSWGGNDVIDLKEVVLVRE